MDYGDVFSRAWRICWNNKYIFVLGFLAALGSGARSRPNFNYSFTGNELPPGAFQNFERFLALAGPVFALLLCVGLILAVVFWLIRLVAQAGLISSAARIDRGEKSSFGQAFSSGTSFLPRFLGLNILIYLPFWILGAVFVGIGIFGFGAAIASAISGQGGDQLGALPAGFAILALCGLALFCLLVPVFVVASVVYAFAQRGIVLQDMGVTQSLGHGWRFVRDHVGDVILLIVFLVVLSILVGVVVAAILFPLGLLSFGPTFLDLLRGTPLETMDIVSIAGGAILFGLLSALLNAVLIAYRSVTVTLAYQDLLGKPPANVPQAELQT